MKSLYVTDATFSQALERDHARGLLGFVQIVISDTIVLDGITLRVSSGGRRYLSYPSKNTRSGARFPFVRPVGEDARLDVQRQVFAALGIEESRS
ncbi:MAG: hypothetical protein GY711_24565 [bacterium]|nr:hypothetical protein [bacterium]